MSSINEPQASPTLQTVLVFHGIHLWGLWSSQLAHHFANEINQGPHYVKHFMVRYVQESYLSCILATCYWNYHPTSFDIWFEIECYEFRSLVDYFKTKA